MFNKLKAIKDMRSQAKQIQNKLAVETVEAKAAHGKITMTMDGNQDVKKVTIDDELMENKSKLEKAVQDVTNESIKKVQKVMAGKMREMGGLDNFNLPGM